MAFRTLITVFILAVVACFHSGCNKLRLGYEYADWLVIYSVEDNFDLDKAQRARFKGDVEDYFQWHRETILPLYADFLAGVSDSLARGLRPEEIDSGYLAFKALYRKTMEPIVDRAVDLLVSLSPAQVDQWVEKQQKKNQKLRKDFSGSPEDQLQRRYEKTVDALEDWTGRLTKEQKKQVRQLSRGLPWNGHLWLDNREKVQGRLAELLKAKASREAVRGFMEEYFLYPERMRSAEYNARIAESERKIHGMILKVHALLNVKQRRHFRAQVVKTAQDFRSISRQD